MTNGNGSKKTSVQLDRDINEVLAMRQKKQAKVAGATSKPRSDTPSQADYERRERFEAQQKLREVEKAPLAERKEAAAEFLVAMRDHPGLVAERIGWLLDGNYGYGAMKMAKQVLESTRMNRRAALTHMIAAFEWSTPSAMAISEWKKLTKTQQTALDKAVDVAIRDAERSE